MANDLRDGRPVFTGLDWHRQPHFSLLVPSDWQRFDLGEGREGVAFSPSESDRQNVLLVEVRALELAIKADDLADLKQGFLAGVRALPGSDLEKDKNWTVGDTLCLEATYSYLENGARRKRWVRVFYKGERQITFIAQGENADAFATWQPAFFEAMMSARLDAPPGRQAQGRAKEVRAR